MRSTFHDLRITPLGHRSARICLSLALRTFGPDSPQFQAVRDFAAEKRGGYIALVRNCVAGFIIHDNRDLEVARILALAVRTPDRREGIGSQLLDRVLRLPRQEVIAHVDERNLETQLFLRSQGFRAVAIERGTPDHYVFKRGVAMIEKTSQPSSQTAGVYS
jgi:ribosomal protein S18 acetylase RimI-like enzyme